MRPPRARTLWAAAGVLSVPWVAEWAVRRLNRFLRIHTGRFHP